MNFIRIQEPQVLRLNNMLTSKFFLAGGNPKMNDFKKTSHRQNIPALVNDINKQPDILHLDYTPSVHKLSECGLDAITAILPLLSSHDSWERLRAQRVLEGVIQRKYGWQPGQGYPPGSNGEEKVRKLLLEMGNYQAEVSKEIQTASILKWKNWLQNQVQ